MILVLGRNAVAAQLAAALAADQPARHVASFDPRDMRDVRRVVQEHEPTVAVWMSSWDDVDAAEANEDRAYLANAEATVNLAAAAMEFGTTPLLISTPEVFGQRGGPWAESDDPAPRSVWAESRRRGEVLLMRAAPRAVVLRVGPIVSVDLAVERAALERGVAVAAARKVSPIGVLDLATVIHAVVDRTLTGIVHAAFEAPIRERKFWRVIAERLNQKDRITEREARTTEAPNAGMRSDRLILEPTPAGWRTRVAEAVVPEVAPPAPAPDDAWATGTGFTARRHTLTVGAAIRGVGRRSFYVEAGKVAVEIEQTDTIEKVGGHFTVERGSSFQVVALAPAIVFDVED